MTCPTLPGRILLLLVLVGALAGCASSAETAEERSTELAPVPSNEDNSHGWGANVGAVQ